MKKFLLVAAVILFSSSLIYAQNKDQDVFTPIGKYINAGDYEKLSAWFADNIELDILGAINNCTRNQAKLIMKNFFNNHTPKKFSIIHKSGKSPMKYAVGKLDAGGENFRIILYVKSTETDNYIEQIKVERD
ncbi:MAG: DUF4783 domain-containing protein [Bacteroidales bacterium]|nr:DUF4783 domain-containing protein [Bacteroidales bacterium]